ncbi:head GIN domain-containing protein [Massilia aurea]|uniref:head GIN domain-containing protein n=1 Tax=Massilia aurea TaxID=373040 RepID=UPI003462368F
MSQAYRSTPALRALMLAAALACAAAPPTAMAWPFGSEQVEGNGSVTRQARKVESFKGIAMGLPGRLELRSGSVDSVTVETDDNLQALIETQVEDGMLRIRPAKRNLNLRTRNLKIVVTARQIERLSLGGSGTIDADVLRGKRVDLDLGGSGKIQIARLDAETVSASVAGSGDLRADGGAVRDLAVSISGSGDVDLGRIASDTARISVAGSGDATVWAKNEIRASIAGSGDVGYYGDPKVSRSVAGSGEVRRIGSAPQ